jgi:riboflavin kinase/FMN adenylyltransferase
LATDASYQQSHQNSIPNPKKISHFEAMRIYRGLSEAGKDLSTSVITLGNFDGVHLGHRSILAKLQERAALLRVPAGVVTFEPHPVQILFPGKGLKRIFSFEDMCAQFDQVKIDFVVVVPFNRALAALPPEQFLENQILPSLHPEEIVIGHDFSFGANRSGTAEFLRTWCDRHGLSLWIQDAVEIEGERVASSRIRELVSEGEMGKVIALLGRPFYLGGLVVTGAGRGGKMGAPTLNFAPGETITPRAGVYVTRTLVKGQLLPSLSNLGVSPTFGGTELKLETHLLEGGANLYGEEVRVEFLHYLRAEKQFASTEELMRQINRDITTAARIHAEQK